MLTYTTVLLSIANVSLAVRSPIFGFAVTVTVTCKLAEVELFSDNVHQLSSEAAAQRVPFMATVNVLLPPAIANFKESGETVRLGFGTTGVGLAVSVFLQETESIIIAPTNSHKRKTFFI